MPALHAEIETRLIDMPTVGTCPGQDKFLAAFLAEGEILRVGYPTILTLHKTLQDHTKLEIYTKSFMGDIGTLRINRVLPIGCPYSQFYGHDKNVRTLLREFIRVG